MQVVSYLVNTSLASNSHWQENAPSTALFKRSQPASEQHSFIFGQMAAEPLREIRKAGTLAALWQAELPSLLLYWRNLSQVTALIHQSHKPMGVAISEALLAAV